MPAAIEHLGSRLIVLDSQQANVCIFSETEYGRLINQAVSLRYDGDESQAVPLWQEVLRLDENNELANSGIGKAYLSAGDNEKALTYLRRGMNLAGNISWILTLVVVLVILLMIWKRVLKPRLAAARTAKGGRTA